MVLRRCYRAPSALVQDDRQKSANDFCLSFFFGSKDVEIVLCKAVGFVPLENMLAFIDVLHAQTGYKAR